MKPSPQLHTSTVTKQLKSILDNLMKEDLFSPFVLVGGTNLSLRFRQRMSDDIDLFTESDYGSLDYESMEHYLSETYPYYDCPGWDPIVGFGRSYYIGEDEMNCVKLDLMYTDKFISPVDEIEGVRMASINDIVAMKMDVISRIGRKKDFWDIHLLHDYFSLSDMINIHEKRYEWTHDRQEIITNLTNFQNADNDPDPRCILGKDWDLIKLDIIEWTKELL